MKKKHKKKNKNYNEVFIKILRGISNAIGTFIKNITSFTSAIMQVSKIYGICFVVICIYVIAVLISYLSILFNFDSKEIYNNNNKDSIIVCSIYDVPIGPPVAGSKEASELERILNEYDNSIKNIVDSEIPSALNDGLNDGLIEKDDTLKKKVYLTFDDGPSEATVKILDILKEHDVKATFFTIAKYGEETDVIYNRIINEGHTLAMHSFSHKYSEIYSSVDAFINDFESIRNHIKSITGYESMYYRFPGGSLMINNTDIKEGVLNYLNQHNIRYYDWNVLNGDAQSSKDILKEEELIANIVNGVKDKDNSVVLMHDTEEKTATVNSLPELIRQLKELDVELLPIDNDTPLVQQVKSEDNISQ